MELRHIRYFIAAAEELHFGRASERLFVTRPAVSQTIADLEVELGVRLFRRQPRDLRLTSAGEAFYKRARAILLDLEQTIIATRRIGEGKSGSLSIGYGSLSLRHPVFREAVKHMGTEYPEADLVLQEAASADQIEDLRKGKIDVGFVFVASESAEHSTSLPVSTSIRDFASLVIEKGGFGVAMPRDHALADRASLTLNDLESEGFIMIQSSVANPLFNFVPRIVQEVSNIATQINLISVGMGVGLVVITPQLNFPPDIRVVPVESPALQSEFRVVWRGESEEPLLRNFLSVVERLSGKARAQGSLA